MQETNALVPADDSTPKKFNFASKMGESERKKLELAQKRMERATTFTEGVSKKRKWDEGFDFYMGRHYRSEEGKRYPYKERAVVNHISRVVDTIIPLLTDSRPVMQAQSRNPENTAFAKGCDSQLSYLWEVNNMDMKMAEALKVSNTKGTAFFKVHFDPFLSAGIGEVSIDLLDPKQLLISPECPASDLDDADYLFYRCNRDIYQLSVRYGIDFGEYEENESAFAKTDTGWFSGGPTGFPASVTDSAGASHTLWDRVGGGGTAYRDRSFQVFEHWYRSAKYPLGRVCIIFNNRIIKEMDNPNPGGWFPFVKLVCSEVPGEVHGKSAVQDLLPLQREANHWRSQIQAHNNKVANPIKIVPRTAGLTNSEKFSAFPGQTWEPATPEDAKSITYLEARPIGQEVIQLSQQAPSDIDAISGIRDAIQGQRPEATVSGRAVAALQEAQMTRIRLQQRNMENCIQRMGQRCLDLALHYYNEKRMIRTMDSRGANEFHEIIPRVEVDINGNPSGKYFVIRKHDGYDEIGNPKYSETRSTLDPQIDVRVITGSSLPISKAQRFQQLMDLFQAHLVLPKHVRESIDWLDNSRIEKDMEEDAAKQGPPPPQERNQNSFNFNMPLDKILPLLPPDLQQQVAQSIAQSFIADHKEGAPPPEGGPPDEAQQ